MPTRPETMIRTALVDDDIQFHDIFIEALKKEGIETVPVCYDTCEKNIKLSNTIKNTEKLMNKMNAIESTSSDWGFFNSSLLPIGNYVGRNLGSCTTTGWVQMSQFSDYNHCGPTAATNILKWFYKRGYSNVYRGSNLATYNGVKSYLVQFPMTGATASLRSGLTNYCSAWGYTLNSTQINTFSQLKTAI